MVDGPKGLIMIPKLWHCNKQTWHFKPVFNCPINGIDAVLRIYPARYLLKSSRTGSSNKEYGEACVVFQSRKQPVCRGTMDCCSNLESVDNFSLMSHQQVHLYCLQRFVKWLIRCEAVLTSCFSLKGESMGHVLEYSCTITSPYSWCLTTTFGPRLVCFRSDEEEERPMMIIILMIYYCFSKINYQNRDKWKVPDDIIGMQLQPRRCCFDGQSYQRGALRVLLVDLLSLSQQLLDVF